MIQMFYFLDDLEVHMTIITNTADKLDALPLMLSTETARQLLNCSDRYVRTLCESGGVKAVKLGRVWRVNRDSLLEFCGLV